MLYLVVFSIILNIHITCMQATCNKTLITHQQPIQSPLRASGGQLEGAVRRCNNGATSAGDGQCLANGSSLPLGNLGQQEASAAIQMAANLEEVEMSLQQEETTTKTILDDLDNLRLEYYKYKILSHLGITANPDLLAPKLQDSTRLLAKAMTSNLATSSATINNQTIDYQKYGNRQNKRHKRSLACSQVKSNKDACCLETFYVNFTDIGWDKWILYPAGYNANYCRGQCDLSHARYYHSTLLSKFSNVIGLCCSPKQMGPLRLLYIDEENKVHQKSMPDMVVESCDCA